jgi:hypothetical protein
MYSMLLSEPCRIFDQLHMTVMLTNLLVDILSFLVGTSTAPSSEEIVTASLSGHPWSGLP